ncbi:hypothetical protein [Streptomyces noursei]|uniref:hypothetical protein n=1 Tax=Streptomyces noursei TaxID=1971 RepID=UPI001678B96D|nr:hypothetical protein [Streptomyces noursei]MCZ1021240.1 hypothetical protein [Streptomyces noursei]GGX53171.1 hypothetical protein GCM10010341_88090 [Streptomyces noursei]
MPEQPTNPDQVLVVNVGRRWSEIETGQATEADVVLGAWSPWKGRSTTLRHFDPDRIAVIVAYRRGKTMAVYDILPNERGRRWHWVGDEPRKRIVFHGLPSDRYASQLHAPPPYTWQRGESTPVKVLRLEDLVQDDEASDSGATDPAQRHAVVGHAVVSLANGGHLTVSVPPEYTVTVTTRPPQDRNR